MADQIFEQKSGFYNAINHDRVYNADDMNQPYKRLVTEGIYPVEDDTTDGFGLVLVSGMSISVTTGGALIAGRWFEQAASQAITVPDNNSAYDRIDSVIIQIDTNNRVGNLVYREGTPAANPQSPDTNQVAGVRELRVWDIYVTAGTTVIASGDLTDYRSSNWCRSLLDDAAIQSLDNDVTALKKYGADFTWANNTLPNLFDASDNPNITIGTQISCHYGQLIRFQVQGTRTDGLGGDNSILIDKNYEANSGIVFLGIVENDVKVFTTAYRLVNGESRQILLVPAEGVFTCVGVYVTPYKRF